MSISDFSVVLVRDLRGVQREVASYPDDVMLWTVVPGIANSGGTLAMHVACNIRHFVGRVLGGIEYERDRESEFTLRDLPRAELIEELEQAIKSVESSIGGNDDARLSARYPMPLGGRLLTTSQFLVHLVAHVAYHLGQIDYHRRMLDSSAMPVGTMMIGTLPDVERAADPSDFASVWEDAAAAAAAAAADEDTSTAA